MLFIGKEPKGRLKTISIAIEPFERLLSRTAISGVQGGVSLQEWR